MHDETYSDNIRVGNRRGGVDFFSIHLRVPDDIAIYSVSLTRYTVPGRNDLYMFDWVSGRGAGVGDRLRYFSDFHLPLARALAMVAKDLDKPQVVKLLVEACNAQPGLAYPLVEQLLPVLVPGSAVLRACRAVARARRLVVLRNRATRTKEV